MAEIPPPPRDPKKLLVEMDARIKVRDIREWDRLRRQVEVKWWESGLVALLFVSGVGIMFTIGKIIPSDNELLYGFILTWAGLFVLTLIACIEFLLMKFRALRRMQEVSTRHIEEMEATVKAIREYLEARDDILEEVFAARQEPVVRQGSDPGV